MKKLILAAAIVALPLFASPALFTKYESVRQGFLKTSLPKVQQAAKDLAAAAEAENNAEVAKLASAVAASPDMTKARANFALLSDELIKVRTAAAGARPAVYSCPMVKKAWLQPKGKIGNPYDSSMVTCGKLDSE